MFKGIDISEWQGSFNWPEIDFIIIRAGDGTYWDAMLEENISKAVRSGIPYGLYWFIRDHSASGASMTASKIIQYVDQLKTGPTMGIWADIEDNDEWGDPSTAITPAISFCKTIEASGYYTGIYCNWYFHDKLYPACSAYDCWIADWDSILDDAPGTLQQYSTSHGTLDLDISFVDDISIYDLKKVPTDPEPEPPGNNKNKIIEAIRKLLNELEAI